MIVKTTDARILIIDSGMFFGLAQRLAPHFKEVLFGSINCPYYPTPNPYIIGDGFDRITQTGRPLSRLKGLDVVVFPDVGMSDYQHIINKYLEIPVWGSRNGDRLELNREFLKQHQKEVGLEVPKYDEIIGLSNLRKHCIEHGECFIKWSLWRGLGETHHFTSESESEAFFNKLSCKLGPAADLFRFIVEYPIEAEIETGIDSVFVGRWPDNVLYAIEAKDKGCISCVKPYKEVTEQIKQIADRIAPWMTEQNYCNFASFEARITKDGTAYLTDWTSRLATPCGEPLLKLIGNLPEIILAGANGEYIEPEYEHPFCAQALMDLDTTENPDEEWRVAKIPEEAQDHCYLYSPCQIDDELFAFPPTPHSFSTVGSVVCSGDSIKECIEHIKEISELIPSLCVKMDGIQAALKESEAMKDQGLPLTDSPIPAPEEALSV